MATHIYLVRHGQSEGNLTRAFLGHTDLPLTQLGREQARLASEYLVTLAPDRIYSSDLLRAYQTAQPTAEGLSLPIETSKQLREIFAGDWESVLFDDLHTRFSEDFHTWLTDIGNSRPTGGESVRELYTRVTKELVRIAKESEGARVMVFLHATPIRALGAVYAGLGLDGMKNQPWPTNASCTHLVFENDTFTLIEYSRDDYLGALVTAIPANV